MLTSEKKAGILAVDCGADLTKVALFEPVNGTYQLLELARVPATLAPPVSDIAVGVTQAITQLEQATGRSLLAKDGSPLVSAGLSNVVDSLVVVVSAADPLRVLVAGLMKHASVELACRAATTTCSTVVAQLSLDDSLPEALTSAKITAIQRAQADVILLAGGVDGGAADPVIDLAQTIAMALGTMPAELRPHVIYAGNIQLRPKMAEILGPVTDFKSVDNISPAAGIENFEPVQAELDILFQQHKVESLPGFPTLAKWASSRIVNTPRSFSQTVHYLGQSYGIAVLGADVGSAGTSLAACRAGGRHSLTRAQVGVGRGLPVLLARTDMQNFQRWLPFEISPADLKNFLHNRAIFPQTVPQTDQDQLIEMAVVREILRMVSAEAGKRWAGGRRMAANKWFNWDLIIGAGQALTNHTSPALAALTLLDGLEPAGICSLTLDIKNLMGMLGGVALVDSLAAAQIMAYNTLLTLATVIAPVGPVHPGETALKIKMVYEDGRQIETRVPSGVLEVFPLAAHEKATLEIRPARRLTLNAAGGDYGKGVAAQIAGGVLGVIVDTRGRPIQLSRSDDLRRRQNEDWLAKLQGTPEPVMSPVSDVLEPSDV